jgi:hypothetical protein
MAELGISLMPLELLSVLSICLKSHCLTYALILHNFIEVSYRLPGLSGAVGGL